MTEVSEFATAVDITSLLRRSGVPERAFGPGEAIFEEGTTGHEAFLLVEGVVEILTRDEKRRVRLLKIVEPGDLFGEGSFLEEARRSASAIARAPTRLLVIDRTSLDTLVASTPQFTLFLIQLFAERLRAVNSSTLSAQLTGELNSRVIGGLEAELTRFAVERARTVLPPLEDCVRRLRACRERSTRDPAALSVELEQIRKQQIEAASALDAHISLMARSGIEKVGLEGFLARRVERVSADTGARIRLRCPPFPDGVIDLTLEKTVFRLIDTCLSVSITQGNAQQVDVELSMGPDAIQIQVEDDGNRHDVQEFARGAFPESRGLYDSLRSRVALSGGTMSLESRPGGGTRVELKLPFNQGR